jgi:hypothetical protein
MFDQYSEASSQNQYSADCTTFIGTLRNRPHFRALQRGEQLNRIPVVKGEIRIGDRAYLQAHRMGEVVDRWYAASQVSIVG